MRMTEQEFQSRYRILILEPTMNVETFHCGDEDLDDFIVHEANQSAVPFYAKNDFLPLSNRDTSSYTRMMYFDLGTMADDGEDAITSRKI